MPIPVGTLEIDLLMDLARLAGDMRKAERIVGGGMDGISASLGRGDRAVTGFMGRFGEFATLAESAATRAEKSFNASFAQIQKMVGTAIKGPTITGGINFGADDARAAAAAAGQQAQGYELVTEAAKRLAAAEADTTEATRLFIQASAAAGIEARQQEAAFTGEATMVDKLTGELMKSAQATDLFVSSHKRLAAAAQEERDMAAAAELAAKNERELAAAAMQVRDAIDPMYAAQRRFDDEMTRAEKLLEAGIITEREYAQAVQIARDTLYNHAKAVASVNEGQVGGAKSTNALRAAMTGLSYQVQDTLTQLSMGANTLQVVAIQGGQAAGQFANIEGRAGSVARFMIGPWGLAITAAALFLGPLIGKLLNTNSALDDAVEKLKKDADETEIGRQAKDRFAQSADGVTAAIREQADAMKKAEEANRTAAENTNILTRAERDRAAAIRDTTAADLERRRLAAQDQVAAMRMQSQGGGQRGELGTLGLDQAVRNLAAIDALIAQNEANASTTERQYQASRVALAEETAKKLATPEGRINKMYDDEVKAARLRGLEIAKNGGIVTSALTDEIGAIEANRQAALKAEQERQAALKATNREIGRNQAALKATNREIGRNIDLNEARKIAESVGGRVTSGMRSTSEQAKLYAKYKAGTGNLAAKPGSSYHEIGQALDVAKTQGMTLKKLVDAYRKAGVKVVEALDEGDHFHIAWAKVGDAAKAQNEAEAQAKRQAEHIGLMKVQTDGLYALAASYKLSGGAALIAAAQEKAQAEVLKNGGDLAAETSRQISLAVAQRVADAEKDAATMREQAGAQEQVNAMVADGVISYSAAGDEMQRLTALRPPMAAADVAWAQDDFDAFNKAGEAVRDLNKAMDEGNAARDQARALAAIGQSGDELAMMKLELSLLGSTNMQRAVAIAQLKAEQEVRRSMPGADPATQAAYIAAAIAAAKQTETNAEATARLNVQLELTADLAQAAGDSIAKAFGQAGSAISGMVDVLVDYGKKQKAIDDEVKAGTKTNAEAQQLSSSLQLSSYVALADAAKGLFKEHSAGYEAMAAAEKAFAIIQLANTATNLAAGAAKMFATLGPWAFPAVAAMVAVMAAFGFSGGGGASSGPDLSAATAQKAQGAGSVLGDVGAKSNSIANALDLMAKNTSAELEFSNSTVRYLRDIDTGISSLTAAIAQQLNVTGGAFDTSGLGLGTNTSVSGVAGIAVGGIASQLPIIGGIINGIAKALFGTTTTKTLLDQGIQFYSATLGSIMQGGIQGANYQLIQIEKRHKFLGISTGTSTSTSTSLSGLDSAVSTQAGLILTSIYSSIVDAAQTIGISNIEDLLKNYTVNLGKISLDGLSGDDLTQAISAVFSKAADDMTGAAIPGITQFQKVGEGLFETLARLAKDYTTVDVQLSSIGRTFGAVGVSSLGAREALIDLFGSLDAFVDQTGFYREHFLTEAEQLAPVIAAVNAEMARLGLSGVTTLEQFKGVVDSLDLTTDAGRQMYAALMAVAQGFYAADQYQTELASKRSDLEIQLMQAQGNAAGALAAQRAAELAAMDASLRPLQQQIYLYQDIATAKQTLTDAYNREKDALTATITKFGDFSTSLKSFRDTLYSVDSGTSTYASALAKLMSVGGLAKAGDETALGNLQGVSSDYLTIAKSNAATLQDYQRAVALVAGYVNGAIGAADSAVDTAQAQLDQMTDTVSQLIDLNDNVISVHDAIVALEQLMEQANPGYAIAAGGGGLTLIAPDPQSGAAVVPATSVAPDPTTLADVVAESVNLRTAVEAMKVDTGKLQRLFDRWDGVGVPVANNGADEPIKVAIVADTPVPVTVIP